jgi:ADP-ribose pyrophosphatase YjhB (NUDIX family)
MPPDEHRSPVVGVGVVVWKGNDVLLIRRGKPPRKGSWSLPGGRQHLGETTRETALREVAEETGTQIRVGSLLDVIDSITQEPGGDLLHYTLVDFDADWVAGDLVAGDDAAAAIWADADDLGRYDLWSETVRIIALSRRRRSGTT